MNGADRAEAGRRACRSGIGKKHALTRERVNLTHHIGALPVGEVERAFGDNDDIGAAVLEPAFAQATGGQQPVTGEGAIEFREQNIQPGLHGEVLKRVIEQNALGFGVAFDQLRHAKGAAFADADGNVWKFSLELEWFVTRLLHVSTTLTGR